MGVPAFYRWLRDKYAKCISPVVEEEEEGGMPIDWSGASPNGVEFDNLYLDMNGIIHPCVHPEDGPAPETEAQMFAAISGYIDRIVCAVRPRKVLFMAIDGVAPRAKMNQQRSRRFKAALEIAEREEVEDELRARIMERGQVPPPKGKGTFDHNVITPGTRFMDNLATHLRYYVSARINEHPAWRGLAVILSDASVPGEGEHKIMEYIRQQRAQPGYHVGVRHILHGLDADLIMLGLATHETAFTILREEVLPPRGGPSLCFKCGQEGHRADDCEGKPREIPRHEGGTGPIIPHKPLQFLHLYILREYLELEFRTGVCGSAEGGAGDRPPLPFAFDLERIIDDFVFLCFFVGNDFLPQLPTLDIREGAIDLLLALYQGLLPSMGGYMTHNGNVHLGRVDIILERLGDVEEEIFRRRRRKEERDRGFDAQRKSNDAAKVPTERKAALLDLIGDAKQHAKDKALEGAGAGAGAGAPRPSPRSGAGASGGAAAASAAAASSAGLELLGAGSAKRPAIGGGERPEAALGSGIPGLGGGGGGIPGLGPIQPSAANKSAAAALRASLMGELKVESISSAATVVVVDVGVLPVVSMEAGVKRKVREGEGEAEGGEEPQLQIEEGGVGRLSGQPQACGDAGVAPVVSAEEPPPVVPPASILQGEADPVGSLCDDDDLSPGAAPVIVQHATERLTRVLNKFAMSGGGTGTDADVAEGVRAVLKDAVSAALTVRHTHEEVADEVQLGLPGWRERYYTSKFGSDKGADPSFRRRVCQSYTEGLVWVFRYYYQGVASWKWFYPFHYAPFASDLRGLGSYPVQFELGRPFRPLDQLMGVLPALSSAALPRACGALMSEPTSPVYDFYPPKFAQDPNGKKFSWMWVVLLPFIDESRLVSTMDSVSSTFTQEERRRNELGNETLFVHVTGHPLGSVLTPVAPTLQDAAALADWEAPARQAVIAANRARLAAEEQAIVVNVSDPAGSGDATRVLTPAISPAVTEAFSLADGRVIALRPDMGDRDGKGISGSAVALVHGQKSGYCVPVGFPYAPPADAPGLPILPHNRVVSVSLLPPTRKAHLTALLPGAVLVRRTLTASDDPSGVVPRLTRGMSVADLAPSAIRGAARGGGGGGYGQQPYAQGGGGRHYPQQQQQQQPPQQGGHPLLAMNAGGQVPWGAHGSAGWGGTQQQVYPSGGGGVFGGFAQQQHMYMQQQQQAQQHMHMHMQQQQAQQQHMQAMQGGQQQQWGGGGVGGVTPAQRMVLQGLGLGIAGGAQGQWGGPPQWGGGAPGGAGGGGGGPFRFAPGGYLPPGLPPMPPQPPRRY